MHKITQNTPAIVGDVLKALRSQRGWTRRQLCDEIKAVIELDLTTHTIATYEHGERAIGATRLAELCHVLGVRTADMWSVVDAHTLGPPDDGAVLIDLAKILRNPQDSRILPAREWARRRLAQQPATLIRAKRTALDALAFLCAVDSTELIVMISADQRTETDHFVTSAAHSNGVTT